MPDPQPKKPRWSQPPPETPAPPPKKPLPTAKPITPPAATPPPPTKPVPQQPLPTPPPANRPTAVPRPTQPLPTPPPATRPPPRPQPLPVPAAPLPAYLPPPEAVASPAPPREDLVANLLAKLHEILAIPGVLFAMSLTLFTLVPMIAVLLFFPSRPVNRGGMTPSATVEPDESVRQPKPPAVVTPQSPPTQPPATQAANQPIEPPPQTKPVPPPVDMPASEPPLGEPSANWTLNDVRLGYEALQNNIVPPMNDPSPLHKVLEECERQARVPVRFDQAAADQVNVTRLSDITNVSGHSSVRQRLDNLKRHKLTWTLAKYGNKVTVLVTREENWPDIIVAYPAADLAPGGEFGLVGLALQNLIAPNIVHSASFDAPNKLVGITAKWPMHDAVEGFRARVRDLNKQNKNGLEYELGDRLRAFGAGAGIDQNGVRSVSVPLGAARFTNDKLALLNLFPKMEILEIRHTMVNGVGIGRLSCAKSLTQLNFNDSGIDNAALQELSGWPKLRSLSVARTKITDEGLSALPKVRELGSLDISQTAVTDTGFATISRCVKLGSLMMGGTRVTDRAADHIAELKELVNFHAADTQIGDVTFKQLAKSRPAVNTLDIRRTAVTGEGLRSIPSFPRLTSLSLGSRGLKSADYAPLKSCQLTLSLTLSQCAIDNEMVGTIRQLKKLSSLTIEEGTVPAIGDLDLPELQHIFINAPDFTDAQLTALCKLPRMRVVHLDRTTAITSDKIEELKRGRSDLHIGIVVRPPGS